MNEELKKDIKNWVESEEKDYAEAVLILVELGPRQKALAAKCKSHTGKSGVQRMLKEEMKALYRKHVGPLPKEVDPMAGMTLFDKRKLAAEQAAKAADAPVVEETKGATDAPVVKEKPTLVLVNKKIFTDAEFDALPEPIRVAILANDQMQKERAFIIGHLEDDVTEEARLEMANTILELGHTIGSNYAAQQYYKDNGIWPDLKNVEEETALDLAGVIKALANAKSNRSKAKTAVKKAAGTAKEVDANAKLQALESKVLRLELLKDKLEPVKAEEGSTETEAASSTEEEAKTEPTEETESDGAVQPQSGGEGA